MQFNRHLKFKAWVKAWVKDEVKDAFRKAPYGATVKAWVKAVSPASRLCPIKRAAKFGEIKGK